MPAFVVVAIVIIVIAAAALVASAARRRDLGSATGQLSRETLKRDASRRAEAPELVAVGATGKEIERAVAAGRSEAVVPAASVSPTVWIPPDPETIGVTRRQFLNRSIITMMSLAIATFAAGAFTAFLWPTGAGGFGSKLRVGKVTDLIAEVQKNGGFLYKPEGRMWLVQYPDVALPKGRIAYKGQASLPGMEKGILALYQKCVHLGCRVPSCATSKWFECPCHGSQYNQVGEKKGGPAPRGLDRFAMEVSPDGVLTVNTGMIIQGPPIGTNTTGQEAQGPHCV
ncbi:MAG: Rieske 2Fe-2S domain-containing protein [Acidimicrobiales bacterium]